VHFAPENVTGKIVGIVSFENADGFLDTGEMETILRLTYSDLKQFTGFILTDANTHFSNTIQWLPLTARHRLNNVLMYDMEKRR
jgi:outer membrane receptor for ferrienterochelin and colicins